MDNLIGFVIADENNNPRYQILRRIGSWGPAFQFPVFECAVINIENAPPNRAVKLLPRTVGNEFIWENSMHEINDVIDFFVNQPGMVIPLLLLDNHYTTLINEQEHLCIVFPYHVSIRHVLIDDQRFQRGLPIPCIRRIIRNIVVAIGGLHQAHQAHGQLSAGNLVCTNDDVKLGALCTSFEPSLQDLPAPNPQFLLPNLISHWGQAPDFDDGAQPPIAGQGAIADDDDPMYQLEELLHNHNVKLDVWNIGVVALELGYGRITVTNRAQFLTAVAYVQETGIMPNTWGQLVQNSEAQFPIYGHATRFSAAYVSFVRLCLEANPDERPGMDELQIHNFVNPHRMISSQEVVNRLA